MADRVRFTSGDAAALDGAYDAVFAFECVHDMPRPVEVLAAAARALTPQGCVVVMDEAVADSFHAPGDVVERLMYGFSLLICPPYGIAYPPSAATGTAMRPDTLQRYSREAGSARSRSCPSTTSDSGASIASAAEAAPIGHLTRGLEDSTTGIHPMLAWLSTRRYPVG